MRLKVFLESKKLHEGFPVGVDIGRSNRKNIASILLKKGVDIENAPSEWVMIDSSRDPRLKTGVNIFVINPVTYEIIVTYNGKVVYDTARGNLAKSSWSKIIAASVGNGTCWHMDVRPEDTAAMRDKQKERSAAKAGSVDRDPSKAGTGKWGVKYDKSGYKLNPDKYKNMLAQNQLSSYQKVLEDAKSVLIELATHVDSYSKDQRNRSTYRSTFKDYDYLVKEIYITYRQIEDNYQDWVREQKSDYYRDEWSSGRESLISNLKHMREIVNDAKALLAEYDGNK